MTTTEKATEVPAGSLPARWQWFPHARYGMFIHFGPYAALGRGEQVLMREMRDQRDYAAEACRWNPRHLDMKAWAAAAVAGGFKYAVMTTRHHDGFCLWDSRQTDYSTARQQCGRDLVREFVEAFRAAGLRVGLYYSLADFRIPAFFAGPERDPRGWADFRDYCHRQVEELLTNYGRIDVMWFDGAWPHHGDVWQSGRLVSRMRQLQPDILINNRLSAGQAAKAADGGAGAGESSELGDFGTPEHRVAADPRRPWESCQVSTWRLWGFASGERWKPADQLLDTLCQCAELGGNLLLNVGPDGEGRLPAEFLERSQCLGRWLAVNGEAVYGSGAEGNAHLEPVLFGRVTRRDNTLYLIVRFLPPDGVLHLPGLATPIRRARRLDTGQELALDRYEHGRIIRGLSLQPPGEGFPVIRCELEGAPASLPWYVPGQWMGDPMRYHAWACTRGPGVGADGSVLPAKNQSSR